MYSLYKLYVTWRKQVHEFGRVISQKNPWIVCKKKISEVYMFVYMFMYTVWAMIHVWFYCYLLHMPASSYT